MKRVFSIFALLLVSAPLTAAAAATSSGSEALIQLDHSVTIAAPPETVWRALTTPAGLRGWIAPESNVELRLDGAYELFFFPDNPDDRGMEGTRILAYVPNSMLATSGEIPGTWVVWRLEPVADGTMLRITSLGSGDEWAERAPYFDAEIPGVLDSLAESVGSISP